MTQLNLDFDAAPLFDQVSKKGGEADFIIDANSQLNFKVNQGKLESTKVSSTRILGVRVIKDNKVGIAYSESFAPDALKLMLEQAYDNAKVSKEDPEQHIPKQSQHSYEENAETLFKQESQTSEALLNALIQLEGRVLGHDAIESCPYNGLTSSYGARRILSTTGLDLSHHESSCSAYAYALANLDGKQSMAGTGQVGRDFSGLQLDELAAKVSSMTLDLLPGTPVPTKHYDVIFSRDTLSSVLGLFSTVFSGKTAQDGVSAWGDKVGQQVAHESLQLIDQPLIPEFGYCYFDDEGLATAETHIIRNGVLETMLHNSVTAKALGAKPTGHAVRGPKSSLNVGYHQLTIGAGHITDSILRGGEYLEITNLTGLHSGANTVTGDFSFGGSGFLCRDGVRERAVRGITIAGNFYELLHRIQVGQQPDWDWQRRYCLPDVRFEGLSIAGE